MAHVIDLSHRLEPGKQRFELSLDNRPVEEYLPQYKSAPGEWYIMGDLRLCTHVGTHVESPFHALQEGASITTLPLQLLVGPAAIVDLHDKRPGEAITATELRDRGAHVREKDIVLLETGRSGYYGTPDYTRPHLEQDAVKWLVDRGIKALGVDCSGIEDRSVNSHEANHRLLFSAGIPLIEDLNALHRIHDRRCFFFAMTLPILGLDASPIRPLAVEPEDAGAELTKIFLSDSTVWE